MAVACEPVCAPELQKKRNKNRLRAHQYMILSTHLDASGPFQMLCLDILLINKRQGIYN